MVLGVALSGGERGLAVIFLWVICLVIYWGILLGRWVRQYFAHNLVASIVAFLIGVITGTFATLVSSVIISGFIIIAIFAIFLPIIAVFKVSAALFAGLFLFLIIFHSPLHTIKYFASIEYVALAIAFVVAGSLAVAIGAAFGLGRTSHDQRGSWAGGLGALVGVGVLGLSILHTGSKVVVVFLLFFLILPSVNSLFDWLSWWTTRALGLRLLAVLDERQGVWQRRGVIVLHSFADLASSVALLLLMSFALGLGFQIYNDLAVLGHETQPFNLSSVIETTAAHPFGEGFWFTLMLLTTLLPTFGHGIMLLGSPLGVLLIPDRKRLALAEDLERYATAGERQPNIRRRAARWHVQERLSHWLLGGALLCWLLGRVWLLYPLGLVDWAKAWAFAGIRLAGFLVGAN